MLITINVEDEGVKVRSTLDTKVAKGPEELWHLVYRAAAAATVYPHGLTERGFRAMKVKRIEEASVEQLAGMFS